MHAIIDQGHLNPGLADRLIGIANRVYETIVAWRDQARQRRALARLDDRLLADIGITREQQFWECATWTWPEWL